jgi:alkyl sulfatase BDS1-like metallo-beta-lactamase superfamily hydrolase
MNRVKLSLYVFITFCQITLLFSQSISQNNDNKTYIHEKRIALSKQFKKEIIKITEGVFVAVGYGASNSVLIEGTDSLIIVDAMLGTEAAENVLTAFRKITDKPISAIIFTHSHSDHVGGASVFARESNPDIYGRSNKKVALAGYEKLSNIMSIRARRQFGSDLLLEEKIAGIAPVYRPMGGRGEGKLKPTQIINAERKKLNIAGIILELVAVPGETDDHLYVWLPNSKALICGDNYYCSFPNLYAIRGTQYRDISKWVNSLDKIIQEEAEYLISGHARPIIGKENVRKVLVDYRDAINFVLNETLKGIDQGMTADELAHSIRLPDSLASKDDLQEFYGNIEWAVRSIYNGYLGWFDGNPTNLFPLLPSDEAKRIVKFLGSEENLINKVKEAISSKDYQWACQLADYLIALDPESKEISLLKSEALIALADKQINSNARHYYLSVAKELKAKFK